MSSLILFFIFLHFCVSLHSCTFKPEGLFISQWTECDSFQNLQTEHGANGPKHSELILPCEIKLDPQNTPAEKKRSSIVGHQYKVCFACWFAGSWLVTLGTATLFKVNSNERNTTCLRNKTSVITDFYLSGKLFQGCLKFFCLHTSVNFLIFYI